MNRGQKLILLFASYLALSVFLSLFPVPVVYGLSTILGTIMGSTVLGTTTIMGSCSVLGSTMLGTTSLAEVYSIVLPLSQLAVSLTAIGLLVFLELSDPAYGKINRLVFELRKSWLPVVSTLVTLFFLMVAFKIYMILA